jgi:hypothetical protein
LEKTFGFPFQLLYKPKTDDFALQVYTGEGRQPVHLDNGSRWVEAGNGKEYATLSCILMLDDGWGTYLAGRPVNNFFPTLEESEHQTPEKFWDFVLSRCKAGDKEYKENKLVPRRAGQLLCFHPGEQRHAGMGPGGYISPLTGSKERVTLYFLVAPDPIYSRVRNVHLFDTEAQTWCLLQQGGGPDRVREIVYVNKNENRKRKRRKGRERGGGGKRNEK